VSRPALAVPSTPRTRSVHLDPHRPGLDTAVSVGRVRPRRVGGSHARWPHQGFPHYSPPGVRGVRVARSAYGQIRLTGPTRCLYAYRTVERPACQLNATVAYGTTGLCTSGNQPTQHPRQRSGRPAAPRARSPPPRPTGRMPTPSSRRPPNNCSRPSPAPDNTAPPGPPSPACWAPPGKPPSSASPRLDIHRSIPPAHMPGDGGTYGAALPRYERDPSWPAARSLPGIAMSRHQPRQALANEFGATDIVTERGDEGVARIKEFTGGLGAHSVTEAVGTQESMMQAIRSTPPRRARRLRRRLPRRAAARRGAVLLRSAPARRSSPRSAGSCLS